MTTEHQLTPEEEAFNRLLHEKQNLLSEDARELVGLAQREAYILTLNKPLGCFSSALV